MALPDTDTMDIPFRGLPSVGIFKLSSTTVYLSTDTMNVPFRGLPADFIYLTASVGGGTIGNQSGLGLFVNSGPTGVFVT